ncbi:hypothetical protein I4U23_020462 [Adineta vaga]|nr:hypothetical protein I4U23_020462 [Adineta vaga]
MNESMTDEKRIVSFFIWDPELERKIDCEVRMIDGISKLLNVVTTLEQTIECHKALILSQQRMLAFMSEIQRKQQNLLKYDQDDFEPTKATVSLSDIRLPLVWTKMKAKSEQKTFAVFCLARIGCEIIDTNMKFIDRHSSDILFTDKLIFNNVPHNFQLHLEIYALNKRLALSSSAKEFANRYSYFSIHGSPKSARKLSEINPTDLKSTEQFQSKFVLIAHTILTKESVSKSTKIRHFKMEYPNENPLMQLPIQDSYHALFSAQPLCYTRLATYAGIVRVYNIPYSCTLTAGFLNGEEIMRDDYSDQHRFSIAITSETIVLARTDQLSFSIYNRGFDLEQFFVEDIFTLNNWIRALQQHVVDVAAWQITYDHLPSMRRSSHQTLTSSPTSSISSRVIRKKPPLRTKAKSLNDIRLTSDLSPSTVTDTINHSNTIINYSVDPLNINQEEDEKNSFIVCTRL